MQQKRKPPPQGTMQRLTKAVTHIRLIEANMGKLASLDALAPVYLALCQQFKAHYNVDDLRSQIGGLSVARC